MGTIYHKKKIFGGNPLIETIGVGGGYAPIGTIIAYMGTTAPQDYLACDGSTYNITDYKQLAKFIESQFGSKNYFGGDGTTTFAVPDLRGEFLRGSGTNSHTNQGNGANVGTHQDATYIPDIGVRGDGGNLLLRTNSGFGNTYSTEGQKDSEFLTRAGTLKNAVATTTANTTSSATDVFTSRPTNTSVLYCIKAVCAGDVYSTDEKVVGTWIDGKPLYQKTVIDSFSNTLNSQKVVSNIIQNVNEVIEIISVAQYIGTDQSSNPCHYSQPLPMTSMAMDNITKVWTEIVDSTHNCNLILYNGAPAVKNKPAVVTIKYTKTTD